MMNIHPDYYNLAQTHTPTHTHMFASMRVYKHTNPLVIVLHVLKTPTSVPICLLCSHAYIQTGGPHTQQHTLTHILPQESSTASQQGYDHPARMIKLVRHQCSLRHVYACVCVWLSVCVSVCLCMCVFLFPMLFEAWNRIEVGGTKVGQCQGETYGTIPLPLGRGIAFTEGESHLLSVWKGRGGEKGNVERN